MWMSVLHGCNVLGIFLPIMHSKQAQNSIYHYPRHTTNTTHHVVTSVFCWGFYLDHNKCFVYHSQVVLLVLGSFSVCWLPYMIVTCTIFSGVCTSETGLGYKAAFSMAMVNSCVNPIIYAWKNPEFRQAIKQLLHCSSPNRIPSTPSFIMANKISFRTSGTNVDSSEHWTTATE
jgi:hypothetical protein